jgi:hypothetical protein
MSLQFTDTLELGKPRRTKDGYLAVRAKAARTGVYQYAGREVDPDNAHGLRDLATVNVLRDEKTVFDAAAAHSFIGKPITDDHPSEAVNASNWKDHARGTIMGAKWEEGGYLAFDLLLTDGAAIAKVDAGKRELSNGYAAELEFGDFAAADGTNCQARQTSIVGNHIALVDRGRAGPECRISDGGNELFQTCDAAPVILSNLDAPEEKPVKKIMIDGLQVDLYDVAAVEVAIGKVQGQLTTALADKATAETQVATLTTDKATLEAKVTTLEKQVADAKLTPQQLRDAAAAFARTTDKAKALGVTVTDSMDEPAIMKAVVLAKVGDAAKDWNDAQVTASFETLTKDAKPTGGAQPIHTPIIVADAANKEAQAFTKANDFNSWRNQAA